MGKYIPEKILWFLKEERDYKTYHNTYRVRPGYAVPGTMDLESKTVENAKIWASGRGRWSRKKDIPKIGPVVLDNKPQRGYRLVGADTRYRGNTAWKVITPEGYLVDLRPDVFLPILYSRGVPASGMLDAEFEWCVSGAQARLEEVGSDNHAKYMTEKEFYAGRK